MLPFTSPIRPPLFAFTQFYQSSLLLVIWIIVQALLLKQNGVVSTEEAGKYIFEARYFLENGNFTSANFWLYSTQIMLIAMAIKLKCGFLTVVIFQLLLNLLASGMLYQLAHFLLKNSVLAFVATLVFIVNIPYQVYNTFLFTESIFYSLTIIYSSYLLRLDKLTIRSAILLLFLLVILSVTRPTGILFFAATALYIFLRFTGHIALWKKLAIISGAVLIFITLLNSMLQAGGSLDFMLPFKKENIICGVNTVDQADIKTLEKGNSLQGILYYIANNQQQFFRLSKLKTIAFFGLLRDYYSPNHNWFLQLFFYPFFLLAFAGTWKMFIKKNPAIFFMIAVIMLYWITTLLTCDDWHNRFFLTISPFIFLIGLFAFATPGTPGQNEAEEAPVQN